MAGSSKNKDREALERELTSKPHQELLCRLGEKASFFQRFKTWLDVVAFMRRQSSEDPQNDEVLRPIFLAHAADDNPRWWHVLTAIFWPMLLSLHWRMRSLESDADDRWQDIHCTFLEVLNRIDVEQRSQRLVQKIVNDTIHQLRKGYRRCNERMGREFPTAPDEFEELLGAAADAELEKVEIRDEVDAWLARLRRHRDCGTISEEDFQLILATRFEGKSSAAFARETGLDPEVARKRRRRAEAAIQRAEARLRQQGAFSDSPSADVAVPSQQGA